MNRLETKDEQLNRSIMRSSFVDARALADAVVRQQVQAMDMDVRDAIERIGVRISESSPYIVQCAQKHVDELDDRYFDADEKGDLNESARFFRAARLVSACLFLMKAASNSDLSEAAYEALSSMDG